MPAPGISLTLARERSARLRDLRYALAIDVPRSPDAPITGRVSVSFELTTATEPLVLDFNPGEETMPGPSAAGSAAAPDPGVRSVEFDGHATPFAIENGHIVIPAEALDSGRVTMSIDFTAGAAGVTRHADWLYTLFVPARAHTFFPCFDQPDLKARLELTLTLPTGWRALANGAELRRTRVAGRERIEFAETVPLPTYLMAIVAGEFAIETATIAGRHMHCLHRERDVARLERNLTALFELHAAALDWLERYTTIDYPFAAVAFALIPDFQFGGMEHAGAVYYRASHLLLEASATAAQKRARASLIAHETAHMWFGNLVTMRWFDDVWLKEVFADFLAAKIVEPAFPDVDHELEFIATHYPAAYSIDRTDATHAIRQPLANLAEAADLYDAIIYRKAPIVMRQLERMIGSQRLCAALRDYLDEFRFGSASWPDLLAILNRHADSDLHAFAHAWIDGTGRPRIVSAARAGADGRIDSLRLVQADPDEHRALVWPQLIEVLAGDAAHADAIPVELDAGSVKVELGTARPAFVLPNGRGIAYGDIVLDSASRAYLLRHLAELGDARTRAAGWITLVEEMLGLRVAPGDVLTLALRLLENDASEQLSQLVLDRLAELIWRDSSAGERTAAAPAIETTLRELIDGSASASLRAAAFAAFCGVVQTPAGVSWLERVWRRECPLRGIVLAEMHESRMAAELALRSPSGADAILAAQLERIEDPDRRARFEFLLPALAADRGTRASFLAELCDPARRRREPWVLAGLAYVHHALRAPDSVTQIRPALDLLPELRATGGIFFARAYLGALFAGHGSPAAADQIDAFLADIDERESPRLRQLLRQAADPVYRAAARHRQRLADEQPATRA